MPGEESVTGSADGKRFRRIVAAGIVLLAGWAPATAVVAANRHQPFSAHALRARFRRGRVRSRVHAGGSPHSPAGGAAGRPSSEREPGGALPERGTPGADLRSVPAVRPLYGVFAAMEPDTGRVVALVGYRRGGESDPWLPLKAIYPAASLIKVVTASAAIERGNVSQDEISYRGGIYGITRRGSTPGTGGGIPKMTLEEAIARSANAVFGKVAVNHVGGPVLEEYLTKFGFGEKIPFRPPGGAEPDRCRRKNSSRPHRRGVRRGVRLPAPHGDDHVRDRFGRRCPAPS